MAIYPINLFQALLCVVSVVAGQFQPQPFQPQSFTTRPFVSTPFQQQSFQPQPTSIPRGGRQNSGGAVQGGIDFSNAQIDPETGKRCVIKEETVESLEKEPILECNHKNVEKCHYTYVTQFNPAQEEVCEENFEKTCQITFKKQAATETVKKCYRPLEKVCNGQGPQECRTVYESACTTKYVEKQPGKFVGDTKCQKLPIEICGAGCTTTEGPEECHDKKITSLIDVPEEICDLNPQKTCRFQTRLVPSLKPEHECTTIPQEVCNLKFSDPKLVAKPLLTKWCLDDSPTVPGETYNESNALGSPIRGRVGRETADFVPSQEEKSTEPLKARSFLSGGGGGSGSLKSLSGNIPFKTQQFNEFRDVSAIENPAK